MVTVSTYAELSAAVLRDEPMLRLEGAAKQYYEKKVGDAFGGGLVGALPGLLIAGPLGAVAGAALGASVGTSAAAGDTAQKELAKFLLRYYRKSSTGVTYIELTHR